MNHDRNRKAWNAVPVWKKAAMAAAAKQNAAQRKAARPADTGFGGATSGASLSVINAYGGAA